MPDFETHKKFVKQNPYKFWYFIENNTNLIEAFYIKYDNSIVLNLIEYFQFILKRTIAFIRENFIPEEESTPVIPTSFYINTSSNNYHLHHILKELDLKSIKISFKV